jgi:hypothetical protein
MLLLCRHQYTIIKVAVVVVEEVEGGFPKELLLLLLREGKDRDVPMSTAWTNFPLYSMTTFWFR